MLDQPSGERAPHVAVIGAGQWGRNHLRVLAEQGALGVVVDSNPTTRLKVQEAYGIPALSHARELSRYPDISAAVVATPAESHVAVAESCLEMGLDLLVEKPLALRADEAMELVQHAEERGRILMVGHLLLFHPAVQALKALIDSRELGEIRYVYSNRLNLGRVRQTENILWSFAPHDVAIILHLLGALPDHVEAIGGSWIQPGIDDITVTHMTFAMGQKAHVFVSWLHPHKEHKLVVVGSRKMAVFDDLSEGAKLIIRDVGVEVDESGVPLERRGTDHAVQLPGTEPLHAEICHFLECCERRCDPLSDGTHAVEVLQVLENAQKSLNQSAVTRR